MPGIHKHPTIAFRPNSKWQYDLINERARLSGIAKKEFYIRSILYSRIVLVGKKENIELLRTSILVLQSTLSDLVSQLLSGEVLLSEEGYSDLKSDLYSTILTIAEILDGASYLFDKEPKGNYNRWKERVEVEQLAEALLRENKLHCS